MPAAVGGLLDALSSCHAPAAPQDIVKLPGDVFKKLSSVVRPTDVGRHSAFVNVNGVATRAVSVSNSSASVGFRRMNSISAVSPGADSCTDVGEVRASAVSSLEQEKGLAAVSVP